MTREEYYNCLSHSFLGSHWGNRKYQNPDGTYTEEGKRRKRESYQEKKKRLDDNIKNLSSDEKNAYVKNMAVNEAYTKAYKKANNMGNSQYESVISSATQLQSVLKNANSEIDKKMADEQIYFGGDLAKFSDKELSELNNRMNLESNYKRLTTVTKKNETREKIDSIFNVATGALTLGILGLQIANYLKKQKG